MARRYRLVALAVIALASMAGCTQLEVRHYDGSVVEGIPYALPQRSLLVTGEYLLTDCSVKSGVLSLKVETTTVTAVPLTEAGERFYLPYSSIRNAFKDSDVTIESYDNGTLKSFSSTVTDKTGPAIAATVGTLVRVAALTGSAFVAASAEEGNLTKAEKAAKAAQQAKADSELRASYCNASAIDNLDKLAELQMQAKALEAKSGDKAKKAKAAAKAKAASDPDSSNSDAEDKISADVDKVKAMLTFKEVEKWTPSKEKFIGELEVTHYLYPRTLLNSGKWVTSKGLDLLHDQGVKDANHLILMTINGEEAYRQLVNELTLELDRTLRADPVLPDPAPGLVVRNPGLALLRVCNGLCPADHRDVTGVVGASDQVVPQLGEYLILPMKNRVFEKQVINLTMSADGVLQKVGIQSTATAASAVESLNSNVDAIRKAKDAGDKAKADALTTAANKPTADTKAVTDGNKAIADCLAAQKLVSDASGKPTGTCQP